MKKQNDGIELAVMQTDIKYIREEVAEIKKLMTENYVTRSEFSPIKNVVYGLVGLVLTGVAGALLTLILKK